MNAFRKNACRAFVALAVILGGSLVSAPSASAAGYGCSGSLIDTYDVRTNAGSGTLFGHVYLYYNSSNGVNCAVNVSNSAGGYGTAKYMYMSINKCTQTSPSSTCSITTRDEDSSQFYTQYAGPVSVTSPNNCILISAAINYNGRVAQANTGATHCG